MFSRKMQMIYGRLMILGMLSMCLVYFGYSDGAKGVSATLLCAQDCDRYFEMCNDSCQGQCSEDSTDANCESCLTDCSTQWNSCSSRATYCTSGGTVSYTAVCQTQYADHCPVGSNGVADCTPGNGVHSGYYQICNTIGGQQCVRCPDHDYCYGSNGLPGC